MLTNSYKRILINLISAFIFEKAKRRKFRARLIRCLFFPAKNFKKTKEVTDDFKVVKEEEDVKLSLPKHVEKELWCSFNELKNGTGLKEVFVAKLENTIYFPKWHGFITKDMVFLNDLSLEFDALVHLEGFTHSVCSNSRPKETYFNGNLAVLNSTWANNYFHWLLSILPKIQFFEQSGYKIDKYLCDLSGPYQKMSLERMGFDLSKILEVKNVEAIGAKNIITSNLPSIAIANMSSLEFIRERMRLKFGGHKEKIFISRRKAFQGRSITNEDEVLDILKPLGFRDYLLEEMTFHEQVELFSNAEIVIAPHGAGLTNILFCPPKMHVVEISNPKYRANCYYTLADMLGLNYYNLLGDGKIVPMDVQTYDCRGNITVNIQKLKKLLKLI